MADDWTTYDDVAEAYAALVEPNGFAALAADLVEAFRLPSPAAVLDVGCGTGAVAGALQARNGDSGFVAGLDVSLAMVRCAAGSGPTLPVLGTAMHLPFGAERFDAVTANLVLSHLDRCDEALLEMVRVLKPGGSVAVTAWAEGGAKRSPGSEAWIGLAVSFVGREGLDEASRRVVPHEARLGDAAELSGAMAAAGLRDVEILPREYRIAMRVADYLKMYEVFTYGRFVRASLGPSRWLEFRSRAEEKVRAVCGDRVEYTARYHVTVGRKR